MLPRLQSVREYFDSDAARYGDQRYPAEARTCEQYSYLIRRDYVLALLERSGARPGFALDLGCGPGVYTGELLDRGWKVWDADLSPRMLHVARRNVRGRRGAGFTVGQTTRLPFPTACFDAVLCIGVMAYVEDDGATLAEIARVLKPGGCAVIQIANVYAPIRAEFWLRWTIGRRLRRGAPDEEDRLREQVQLSAHYPGAFVAACRSAGLALQERRYYDFRVPLLAHLWSRAALGLGRLFEKCGHLPWIGWWGAGLLVRLRRVQS